MNEDGKRATEMKPRGLGPSVGLKEMMLKSFIEQLEKPAIVIIREEDHIKVHALGWGTGVQGHADKLAALKAAQVLIAEQLQLATAALLNDGCDELEATAPTPARNRPPEKKL